jgi:cytochrome b561
MEQQGYNLTARIIHWAMAILIIALLVLGHTMVDLPRGPEKNSLYGTHMSLGLLAGLAIVFWLYRKIRGDHPPSQNKPAKYVHLTLFVLLLLMPVSGLLMAMSDGHAVGFFGLFEIPAFIPESVFAHDLFMVIHNAGQGILIVLLTGHIAAALYHQFYLRDGTLMRMMKKG